MPENLVPVCGDGTRGDHGRLEARDPDARAALGAALTPDEAAYVVEKMGEEWLWRRYQRRLA